jgi:hypothetical protein
MNETDTAGYLRFLDHLASDTAFLAYDLVTYAQRHGMESRDLAERLDCDEAALRRLKACIAPNPHSSSFPSDVQRIAAFTGCDSTKLLGILRECQVIHAMQSHSDASITAMAARDRQITEDDGARTPHQPKEPGDDES